MGERGLPPPQSAQHTRTLDDLVLREGLQVRLNILQRVGGGPDVILHGESAPVLARMMPRCCGSGGVIVVVKGAGLASEQIREKGRAKLLGVFGRVGQIAAAVRTECLSQSLRIL